MPANLENSAVTTGLEKVGFHSSPKERQCKMPNVQTTIQVHSFYMLTQLLKSFKLSLNSMWTKKFQMYKLDLEKAEDPEIKLPTRVGS